MMMNHKRKNRKRKLGKFFVLAGGAALAVSAVFADDMPEREFQRSVAKTIVVSLDGTEYIFDGVTAQTVAEVFDERGIETRESDRIFPDREAPIASGSTIFVERKREIVVTVDGGTKNIVTFARTVGEAIDEAGISLDEEDIVVPSRETFLKREMPVKITRVEIREETVEKKIPFETVEKEDETLSFRKRIVKQKGENGIRTYRYRVSYHDGKEVARKLLGSEVTKEPVTEVVTQGTYVKTGKSHRGAASWYAHTGTMAAANPWLPIGSYVRVTNLENGKSVIVKINDRGPFVPGRIIDLDKVAFQQIASLGSGVINVKVEEVIN